MMKRFKISTARLCPILATALSLVVAFIPSASACGPDFEGAVMINGKHPDLPLKLFAKGNLGIVQPSWAQSYLIVAYRYLSSAPLNAKAQESIVQLWHRRLQQQNPAANSDQDPVVQFFALRAKVLNLKFKSGSSKWDFEYGAGSPAAFDFALGNLRMLIQKHGLHSPVVRDWLKAQDIVFAIPKVQDSSPILDSNIADYSLRMNRLYQRASLDFYANDMSSAKEHFEQLAKQGGVAWRDLAWYMAARSVVTQAIDMDEPEQIRVALHYVLDLLSRSAQSKYSNDIYDLYQLISAKSIPMKNRAAGLMKSVLEPGNTHFGSDVSTITSLIEGAMASYMGLPTADREASAESIASGDKANAKFNVQDLAQYDLTDWLANFQEPDTGWWSDEEKEKWETSRKTKQEYALKKWRRTGSLPWMIAALKHGSLNSKLNSDLMSAAEKLQAKSPAYLTARFFIADRLIRTKQFGKAGAVVRSVLLRKDLPPTARNLFMLQALPLSRNAKEYLGNVVQNSLAITPATDCTQVPKRWMSAEQRNNFHCEQPMVSNTAADDLNANLPQAEWLIWANDKSLPRSLRAQVVRSAWLRSKLLDGQSTNLDAEVVAFHPSLKQDMEKYKAASDPVAKRFALAWMIIKREGMSPYIHGGVERHSGKMDEFDYFNANFWLPYAIVSEKNLQDREYSAPWTDSTYTLMSKGMNDLVNSYGKGALGHVLTDAKRKQALQERTAIWANHPSRFLGEAIIAMAKSHPTNPLVPEALYRVVKLPKWSGLSDVGSKYSRSAYMLLRRQYPSNRWTRKAICWY